MVSPELSVLADGGVVLTYWTQTSSQKVADRFVVPVVAVRKPFTTEWLVTQLPAPAIDLSLLPTKCGDTNLDDPLDLSVFMGDQHPAVGGLTHGHYMRAESGAVASTMALCSIVTLWSAWRP